MTDCELSKIKINTNIRFGEATEEPVVDSGNTVVVVTSKESQITVKR